ncbi:CheF family chemotaxis protein [Methanocaldococcus infernus]
MKFSGVGFFLKRGKEITLFDRWEKLDIFIDDSKIIFEFQNKELEIRFNDIIDIDSKVPKKVRDLIKTTLEGAYNISSIVISFEEDLAMIAFGVESSIYGEFPVKSVLKEILYKFILDKELEVLYNIKKSDEWKKGKLKLVKKKIKVNFITKIEEKILFETRDKEYYDIFSKIKDVNLENGYLRITQSVVGKKVTSYLSLDDELKYFLLKYLKSVLNVNVGLLKEFKTTCHFESFLEEP